MKFATFQLWRQEQLRAKPEALDCAETNLYQSLAALQPKSNPLNPERPIHRCDLAHRWLSRYGFSEKDSHRALVCRGVRHALSLIFKELARERSVLFMPNDVYPVYLELARAAGVEPKLFPTLPEPNLPHGHFDDCKEYLLLANPWKPLGRFITDQECAALLDWLNASDRRCLLIDCVYDLGTPFHCTTEKLMETGQAILLHSVTKGWLWPKTFGVALLSKAQSQLELAFRGDPPSAQQLWLAEQLLSEQTRLPNEVSTVLGIRRQHLLTALPPGVNKSLLIDPGVQAPGCYFFPVGIPAEALMQGHNILGIPASAFGAQWDGSILTSLAACFATSASGGPS